MRHIFISTDGDGIATLTLDNADESVNLVSDAWITEMIAAIATLTEDKAVRGVILTSGKKSFMAGADLKMLVEGFGQMSRNDAFAFAMRASNMHRAIEKSGKPWVAIVDGLALGGGFELALACHRRILSDDPKSLVGLPEVNVGLLPGSGGTQRLMRIAGYKVAIDLLLSGRQIGSEEALRLGIVDEVAPSEQLAGRARAWLATGPDPVKPWDRKNYAPIEAQGLLVPAIAGAFSAAIGGVAKQGGHNRPALPAILSALFEGMQLPFDKALAVEAKYFALLLTDPVARNIIRTTFISKAAAERGLRRPEGIPKSKVAKLGVIGAGMMGSGIALVSAIVGIDVVLIDRDVETAQKGKDYSIKALGRDVENGKRSQDEVNAILDRINPTDDFSSLAGADLVIEAVFEDTGIKAETTRRAEQVIPDTAIFASNTSTLPIGRLAEASIRPEQFIGLHFFSPVDRMGLVEVIVGARTSPATVARSLDFIAQIKKTPVVVNDSRGFYTSRVFQTLIHEGAAMLREGVPPAVIENAATAAGFPVGPLALLDEVTFDLPLKIVDQAIAEEGPSFDPPIGVPTLRLMRDDLGRSGRKAGGGFYDYPAGQKKHLWRGLAEHFPPTTDYDFDELNKRFLFVQAMETLRCMEEGVLTTPQDADLGAIYGWGFPAWTGGTVSYVETIGIERFVREAEALAQKFGARYQPSAWLRDKAASGETFYPSAAKAA